MSCARNQRGSVAGWTPSRNARRWRVAIVPDERYHPPEVGLRLASGGGYKWFRTGRSGPAGKYQSDTRDEEDVHHGNRTVIVDITGGDRWDTCHTEYNGDGIPDTSDVASVVTLRVISAEVPAVSPARP